MTAPRILCVERVEPGWTRCPECGCAYPPWSHCPYQWVHDGAPTDDPRWQNPPRPPHWDAALAVKREHEAGHRAP